MKVGQESSVNDPAVLNDEKVEAFPFYSSPCRRDGFEFALVCALDSVPDPDLRAIGKDIVNSYTQIRKSSKVSGHALLQSITADDASVDGKLF